jgi:copper chaperone CopZ
MEALTLAIGDMSCGHCVALVKQTLAAVPGVQLGEVSVGAARLAYDAALTTPEKIAAAVSAVGYPARVANARAQP